MPVHGPKGNPHNLPKRKKPKEPKSFHNLKPKKTKGKKK